MRRIAVSTSRVALSDRNSGSRDLVIFSSPLLPALDAPSMIEKVCESMQSLPLAGLRFIHFFFRRMRNLLNSRVRGKSFADIDPQAATGRPVSI